MSLLIKETKESHFNDIPK